MRNLPFEEILKEIYINNLDDEIESAKNWFKKTFVGVKMSEQLLKLEEELREIKKAYKSEEQQKRELADVMIVIGGLRNFNSVLGDTLLSLMLEKMNFEEVEEITGLINEKMKINKSRKWYKTKDGRYRHDKKKINKKNGGK